jgi:6 kDa early secretory antigenic target
MSSRFQVDTARIQAASGDVTRISAEIESSVRAMMGKLNALQDAWQGSASSSFQGVTRDWERTQHTVRESLDHISVALQRAGVQYSEVEQANTSMFTAR